jgi:mono/diheme cytochrome c family protein
MVRYDGTQFPEKYRGGAFIAFHGSWNRAPKPQKGYNVTFVPFDDKGMPTGSYEVFADGFAGRDEFTAPRDARFRPGGVAVGPDGSLYVSDTEKGRVWRIFYTGEEKAAAAAALPAGAAPAAAKPAENAAGANVYKQTCAVCHMVDGSGVPGMQPALDKSTVLTGDPGRLVRLLLLGAAKALPASRPHYSNAMPTFEVLKDQEIADVLNYARTAFGKRPSAITAAQVAAIRAKP